MSTLTTTIEDQRGGLPSTRARLLNAALAQSPAGDEPARTLALATAVLEDAVREQASDIHLDPTDDGYEVRFRIDGVLIVAHTDEHTLRRHLRSRGSLSLLEDDLAKVAEGMTSIAEFQAVGGMGFFASHDDVESGTEDNAAAAARN